MTQQQRIPEEGLIITARHADRSRSIGVITKLHPNEQFTVTWEPYAQRPRKKRYPFRSFSSFSVQGKVEVAP